MESGNITFSTLVIICILWQVCSSIFSASLNWSHFVPVTGVDPLGCSSNSDWAGFYCSPETRHILPTCINKTFLTTVDNAVCGLQSARSCCEHVHVEFHGENAFVHPLLVQNTQYLSIVFEDNGSTWQERFFENNILLDSIQECIVGVDDTENISWACPF